MAQLHLSRALELEERAGDYIGAERHLGGIQGLDDPQPDDAVPVWGEVGHVHEALFFTSTGDLVSCAVPPLEHALLRGDLVILGCAEQHNRALRQALGAHQNILELPRPPGYRSAVTTFSYYRQVLEPRLAAGGRRVWLLAQPGFDTDPCGWDEWRRFEALCHTLLRGYDLTQICVYDLRNVPETVTATAELSHRYVRDGGCRAWNPFYIDPADLGRLASPPDELAGIEPDLAVSDMSDVAELQARLFVLLTRRHIGSRWIDELLCALNEVVTNLVAVSFSSVTVRVWVSPARVVCSVSPQVPASVEDHRMEEGFEELAWGRLGLRVARRLCDDLVAVRDPEQFSIRISKRR